MFDEKGVSLPIMAIIILVLAVIVMLAVVALFTDIWDPEIFEDTKDNVTDIKPDEDSWPGSINKEEFNEGFQTTPTSKIYPLTG